MRAWRGCESGEQRGKMARRCLALRQARRAPSRDGFALDPMIWSTPRQVVPRRRWREAPKQNGFQGPLGPWRVQGGALAFYAGANLGVAARSASIM
jgi:hypothetical protein